MPNSRRKGSAAEREFIKKLGEALGVELKRNLDQTRDGGYDILGLPKLAIEVKRHESLSAKAAWWRQACKQAKKDQYPVLAYRQSRKPWTIVIPLAMVAPDKGWGPEIMSIDLPTFVKIIKREGLNG